MYLSFNQVCTYFELRLRCPLPAERRLPFAVRSHLTSMTTSMTLFINDSPGFNCHGQGAKGSIVDFEVRWSNCD
jgi:hypothetical protein